MEGNNTYEYGSNIAISERSRLKPGFESQVDSGMQSVASKENFKIDQVDNYCFTPMQGEQAAASPFQVSLNAQYKQQTPQ